MDTFMDNYTLTQSLPTIQKQIDQLQMNLRRPAILNQSDIGFLLLTAHLRLTGIEEWDAFLANLGMTREMGEAYMNLSKAALALNETLRALRAEEF